MSNELKLHLKPVKTQQKAVEPPATASAEKVDKVKKPETKTAVVADKKSTSPDVVDARKKLEPLVPPPVKETDASRQAKAEEQLKQAALAATAANGGKKPQGYCGRAFKDLVERYNLPGAAIPRQAYAHGYADFLNSGNNAEKVGLKRLNIDNPYDAPPGAYVVVAPGTPGTRHPTAGDITIAEGNGRFINDGEMNYHGRQNFPPGNKHVLGIYVPIGSSAAGFDASKNLTDYQLKTVMPGSATSAGLSSARAAEVLPVVQDAMRAADINTPERAAAFVSSIARGSHDMKDLDFVVEATKTWKAKNLNAFADKGDIGAIAGALKLEPARPGDDDLDGIGPSTYDASIRKASAEFGVPPRLIKAMMKQESAFNPNAHSGCDAHGLLQLIPGTYRSMQEKYGISGPASDPESNIRAGTAYLAEQLQRFGGDVRLALAAYNAGPGAVNKCGGVPPFKETQDYVQKITATYGGVSAASNPYYQRALDAFGVARPSQYASTGHDAHRSYLSRRASGATPRDAYADASNRQELAAMRSQDPSFDLSYFIMEMLIDMLSNPEKRAELLASLYNNPEFVEFVRSQQGMGDWTPDQAATRPVDQRVLVEFLGNKMTEVASANSGTDVTKLTGDELKTAMAPALGLLQQQLADGTLPRSNPSELDIELAQGKWDAAEEALRSRPN